MESDKKTIIDCPHFTETINGDKVTTSVDEPRKGSRATLKRLLIIITACLLVLMVVIFIIAVIVFSLWTTRIQLQETNHRRVDNHEVDEELYQDTKDSLTFYHVQDQNTEHWVVLDINRELEIIKVKTVNRTTCYVTPSDPDKIMERNMTTEQRTTTSPVNQTTEDSLPVVQVRVSSRTIREKSILGKKGQELCDGIDTFWTFSPCTSPSPSDFSTVVPATRKQSSRVRRQAYTYYSCGWDWNRCFYFSFPDSPQLRYYRCEYACGYQTIQL